MTDACYRIAVEQRIRECWRIEQWYRTNRWAEWDDLRHENKVQLRVLVSVARAARKGAAAAAKDYDRAVAQWVSA